jgi:hypothetical protein
MKKFLANLWKKKSPATHGGSKQPSNSSLLTVSQHERALVKAYKAELKTTLENQDLSTHAKLAERLILLTEPAGFHAKIQFIRLRGETGRRLVSLAQQAYSLDNSLKSSHLLASFALDHPTECDLTTLLERLIAEQHPDGPTLSVKHRLQNEGRTSATNELCQWWQNKDLTPAQRTKLFTAAATSFPDQAKSFGETVLNSAAEAPLSLLTEATRHFLSSRHFPQLQMGIDALEARSPLDAVWFRNATEVHRDARSQPWIPSLQQVAKASAANDPNAKRLLPHFYEVALAEASKHSADPDLILALAQSNFELHTHRAADINVAIGLIRRLNQLSASHLNIFVQQFKLRLCPPGLPLDWLGNLPLQIGKMVEILTALSLYDQFIDGIDLDILPHAETWLTAYEFTTARSCGPLNAKIIQEHCHFQRYLSKSSASTYFDVRVASQSQQELLHVFETALRQKQPFLAIRLGDGEAYGFPKLAELNDNQHAEDRRIREIHWWGRTITPELSERICQGYDDAVNTADLIGIPSSFRLLRDLDAVGASLLSTRTPRGIVSVIRTIAAKCETGQIDTAKVRFTDERFHQALFSSLDALAPCIASATKVIIVSCYSASLIRSRISLPDTFEAVLIPPHTMTVGISDYPNPDDILPEIIYPLLDDLRAITTPGSLVLVAAGFAGKLFLKAAKDSGGVALDIGATLDYWMGIKTRSHVDMI